MLVRMKRLKQVGIVVAVLLVLIQLVPVDRENPPVETELDAPAEVLSLLRRSCYDCHSHETEWPWYSYVAPASWLVAKDVDEGREYLNFSTWNAYDAEKRRHLIEEIWEEVEAGEMPLWFYLPLHPSARLDEADLELLEGWTRAALADGATGD